MSELSRSLTRRSFPDKSPIYTKYVESLPRRPYCKNEITGKRLIRPAEQAVKFLHLQPNTDFVWRWMVFDIDSPESFTAHEDHRCPPPTYIALNRENGHGHAGYLLETPVTAFTTSSAKARSFYLDVQRGMTFRLGADTAYTGDLTKNPLHPHWETAWLAQIPHRLDVLNDCLSKEDKRRRERDVEVGMGRNVTLFDSVRARAYKQVLKAKKAGLTMPQFQSHLEREAVWTNSTFALPLPFTEVRSICRSVASWCWEEFTVAKFSHIQRQRALVPWKGVVTLKDTKPWEAAGISRATWFRNRSKPLLS